MSKKYDADTKAADNLADALVTMPEEFVHCRDLKHAWDVTEDFHVVARKGQRVKEIQRGLTCLRCKTGRKEVYHLTSFGLEKASNTYSYPEGYQIHGVPRGNKPASIVHAEVYRRTMEKIAQAQIVAEG